MAMVHMKLNIGGGANGGGKEGKQKTNIR